MTVSERQHYHQALSKLRARVQADAAQLFQDSQDAERDAAAGSPLHGSMSEVGEELANEGENLSLLANEKNLLVRIDAALARLATDSFGHCQHCQTAIGRERLDVLPFTEYCVRCAELQETR